MVNKKKILIGSADPDFAFGIKSQLEGMGAFSPVLVTGARELIEVEQMFYFSVILIDALLDDFPGFEVCRKLREAGRNTPIILFSRISEQECAKIRNSWQADRCLVKSVPVPDLFERIREVIEAKAKTSPREAQPGKRPAEPKEEKFDGLEEIVKKELLEEISPEAKAEPEIEESPVTPEPEAGPVASSPAPEALELPVTAEPPRNYPESIPPALEPPSLAAAPAAQKSLAEEFSSKLDELEMEEEQKPAPAPSWETRETEIPTEREGREEAVPEPEAAGSAEIIPEPETAEEVETINEEDLIEEEIPKEINPGESIPPAEKIPPREAEAGEAPEPVKTRRREMVSPAAYEPKGRVAHFVPWGSALKILVILAGLGLGLGYFLAK
jgi:CheY-like chemotaxis protein